MDTLHPPPPEVAECCEKADWNKLQGHHKRTAAALAMNIQDMVKKHGIERIGFLTLTFPELVTSPKEAQRRFNSLATHVLKRYTAWIRVFERHKSGGIHYHLLVVCPGDIRAGFRFGEAKAGNYQSASPLLKAEWKFWRETAERYGFGRTELLPIKSNREGIARYVGKYVSKHIGQRIEADKGVRMVEYSKGAKMARTAFAWVTPRAQVWRQKLAVLAERARIKTYDGFQQRFGQRWAWQLRDAVAAVQLTFYRNCFLARADGHWVPSDADLNKPFRVKYTTAPLRTRTSAG